MTPHGWIDADGQPHLVSTIPANNEENADQIIRDGWLKWADETKDPNLRAQMLEAATKVEQQ